MEITYNLTEVKGVAKQLINNLTSHTILIYGAMGVGKTTLIRAIAELLGSADDVSSPTFSIVNEYGTGDDLIYHFDLYRIKDVEELYNLGIEEYIFSNNWLIIEWPEIIEHIVPLPYDKIELKLNTDNTRTLKFI